MQGLIRQLWHHLEYYIPWPLVILVKGLHMIETALVLLAKELLFVMDIGQVFLIIPLDLLTVFDLEVLLT